MDLQTLFVALIVGIAAAFVIRTFTRQFSSRDRKGCGSCSHGGTGLARLSGPARQAGQVGPAGASRDEELIQVEPIQVKPFQVEPIKVEPVKVEESVRK